MIHLSNLDNIVNLKKITIPNKIAISKKVHHKNNNNKIWIRALIHIQKMQIWIVIINQINFHILAHI